MAVERSVQLRPNYTVSRIIKGGWQLSGDHGTVNPDKAVRDMIAFVDAGITAFDCADIYTGVEEMIGRFLTDLRNTRGAEQVKRVKIHTKYVPDQDSLGVIDLQSVEAVIDWALSRLGQDRLDLVQFHWWDYKTPGFVEVANHLNTLRDKGKIDLIGVTNFDTDHLMTLCEVVDIASAQVQYSLLDARVAGKFAHKAHQQNVKLICYGVLAGGFLTDAWLGKPDPGYQFENRSLVKYRLIIDEFGSWSLFQALLTALRGVADRYNVDIATIAVRSMLDNPDVAATIVGARYADRLPYTLRAFEIEMTDRDRRELNAVIENRKGPNGPVFGLERDTTGRHGSIMKYNLNKGDDTQMGNATAEVAE